MGDVLSDGLTGAAVVLGALAVLVVLLLFGIPLVLAIVDLVVVVVVVVGGALARLLFRRPWTVEACSDGGDRVVRHAVGWRGSGEAVDELATEITHGRAVS